MQNLWVIKPSKDQGLDVHPIYTISMNLDKSKNQFILKSKGSTLSLPHNFMSRKK